MDGTQLRNHKKTTTEVGRMSEETLTVSYDDLIGALDLLHEVFWNVKSVSSIIAGGNFSSYSVIEQLRDSWNKMSKS